MNRVTCLVLIGYLTLSINALAQGTPAGSPGRGAASTGGDAATVAPPAEATPAAAAEAAPKPPPSVTLKQGAVFIQLNVEMGLNKGTAFKPVSIAPDISYGATDDLTVSLIHSAAALNGFRGTAGAGLCITGTSNGCVKPYTDVGVEGVYSLLKGPLALGANLGVIGLTTTDILKNFDLKLGIKGKYTAGRFFVAFSPSVWVGLNSRDTNPDQLWIPVGVGYKVTPEFIAGVASGFKSPLKNLGDSWTVPVGVNAQYAINKQIAIGSSFVFGKILGASALSDANKTGADYRALHVWLNYSM